MGNLGSSRRQVCNIKKHQDVPQNKINLTGLKHQLHGTSYQVKLGIVASLANAKKVLEPTEKFSFTVTAEDPTAGKFDDIVYDFKHGDKTGTLKIQAKHKLSLISSKSAIQDGDTATTKEIQTKHKQESSIPKITLKDFIADPKNDFYIQQYFKSFLKQPQKTNENGREGLIICTNAGLDDDAKVIWDEMDIAALGDSTTFLDSYISSLFDKTGGKCYKLKAHYKRSALVKLLMNAIKSEKEMVTWQRPLFKEYRAAILDIIDKDSISGKTPSFKLTENFLNPTYSNSKPGYEAFRKEFKEQIHREFGFNENGWESFKRDIKIHVSKDFMVDKKNAYPSSDSFPLDNEEEPFKSFCDRFCLVCGTYNEQRLDDTIVEIWRNLYFGDEHLSSDRQKVRIEESMVTDKLFKTYFNWLKDPYAKPLHSDDIKADLENIEGTLAYMKLHPISDQLRKKVVGSPFRVSANALRESKLLEQVETESLLTFETYDIKFAATVLSDILDQQAKKIMFIEDHEFVNISKNDKSIIHSLEQYVSCLIIICKGLGTVPVDILTFSKMQVFVIKNPSNTQAKKQAELVDFNRFRICDLTEESWSQFLEQTIPLCTTAIFPSMIFHNNFRELPIEDVIKLIYWGKQMEDNNKIARKYRGIESTYVHRPWVNLECKLKPENVDLKKAAFILKSMKEALQQGMSLIEISKNLKNERDFSQMFGKANNQEEEHKPIIGDVSKKVLILLGEAGFGKTTNLTWLAWYLRNQNPSSWIVQCNLSDHCIDLKPFIPDKNRRVGKAINETEALIMLYILVRSSLQPEREMSEKCLKHLTLSKGQATVSKDLMENLSLNNSIELLVFKEKFNADELVLLLDGFDEIAPNYKEVMLQFLSYFEQFKGVRKLYLTSRPYAFKEHFKKAFKDPSFFQLYPLSLLKKESILFKIMKKKWHKENMDDEGLFDFYKSLCFMLLCSLNGMSDVPLNLMMAVDILGDRIYHNEDVKILLSSKIFTLKVLELIEDLSKASFIVEEFLKIKIRHRLYDKNGADKNVAHKPQEMERFEKTVDEVKLRHGLVAFWVLFNENERRIMLLASEIRKGKDYIKKIHEGSEKTGIIHSNHDGSIKFIHRSFAEYLAAWWIVKQRIEGKPQDFEKISCLESFWSEERKELRENIDTILAKRHPLHLDIDKRNLRIAEFSFSNDSKSLCERDDGNRTPTHASSLHNQNIVQQTNNDLQNRPRFELTGGNRQVQPVSKHCYGRDDANRAPLHVSSLHNQNIVQQTNHALQNRAHNDFESNLPQSLLHAVCLLDIINNSNAGTSSHFHGNVSFGFVIFHKFPCTCTCSCSKRT